MKFQIDSPYLESFNSMRVEDFKKNKLPDSPGVYFFRSNREVLYIGKATSLSDRVRSYFSADLIETRGPLLVDMVTKANNITFQKTESVLEAIILEAELIKKHQPYFNSREKDDKSFNCVVITEEDFPRVLVVRKKDLDSNSLRANSFIASSATYGPFPHGAELKEALKIIRKIFPYRDRCVPYDNLNEKKKKLARPCFNALIGLCPGVCNGSVSKKEYADTIHNLKLFFSGKMKVLFRKLEKQMLDHSNNRRFEKAGSIKKTLSAISHIQDVALIKHNNERVSDSKMYRIEAYDIAHIGGESMVGVMVVIENGEPKKSEYKKFRIKSVKGANDTKALEEVLLRRLKHEEWVLPNMVVFDGGIAQENVVKKILKSISGVVSPIEIVGVVKDERHKPRDIITSGPISEELKKAVILANSEAHRFAIAYHKNIRGKNFLP